MSAWGELKSSCHGYLPKEGGGGGGGGQKILGENEKLHNYGIKTNYFNLL